MNPMQQRCADRRLAVLAGHAAGQTNAQIARGLGVSEETVRSLAYRLKNLLGAASAAHAVALGFRYGLLDRAHIHPVERASTSPTPTSEGAAA